MALPAMGVAPIWTVATLLSGRNGRHSVAPAGGLAGWQVHAVGPSPRPVPRASEVSTVTGRTDGRVAVGAHNSSRQHELREGAASEALA